MKEVGRDMGIRYGITRANNGTPKMTRAKAPVHSLFQLVKNGRPTGSVFANLGYGEKLRKFFSIGNKKGSKEGVLFGSATGTSEVALVGNFNFEVDLLRPSQVTTVLRSSLKSGDVFQVPGSRTAKRGAKPPMYVHLGPVADDRKVLSYNLNTKKLAIGTALRKKVAKVGEVAIATQMAA